MLGTARTEHASKRLLASDRNVTWPALGALIADFESSPSARIAAIRVMSEQVDPEKGLPTQVLLAVARDPSPDVRREAAQAIVRAGDPESDRFLAEALAVEADAAVRADIEAARTRLAEVQREWYLRKARESVALERFLAVRALGPVGTPDDVPVLRQIFDDAGDDGVLRMEVVHSVCDIGGDAAKAFVREQLESRDPYLRAAGAQCQVTLRDPETVPRLQRLLQYDGLGDVQVASARALAAIGGPEARNALETGCKGMTDPRLRVACKESLSATR